MKKIKAIWIYIWVLVLAPLFWCLQGLFIFVASLITFIVTFEWRFIEGVKDLDFELNPIKFLRKTEKYAREGVKEVFQNEKV